MKCRSVTRRLCTDSQSHCVCRPWCCLHRTLQAATIRRQVLSRFCRWLVTSVSWWCVYREALVDRSWWMKSVSSSTSLRKITSACDTSMLRNNGSVVSCYPLSLTALPHALHTRRLFWPQLGLNIHLKFAAECWLGHSSEVCCLLNCLLQGGYICWRYVFV